MIAHARSRPVTKLHTVPRSTVPIAVRVSTRHSYRIFGDRCEGVVGRAMFAVGSSRSTKSSSGLLDDELRAPKYTLELIACFAGKNISSVLTCTPIDPVGGIGVPALETSRRPGIQYETSCGVHAGYAPALRFATIESGQGRKSWW